VNSPLIDAQALVTRTADDTLVVDCRFDLGDPHKGYRDYLQGHIPGAVHASLDEDLSDLSRVNEGEGRHPLPDSESFARTLGSWGWSPGMCVVACDASGGAIAARLWWMLQAAGISSRVLDGGIAAWREAGFELQPGPVQRTPTRVSLQMDAARHLGTEALQQGLRDGTVLLVDARAASRFRGEEEPLDPVAGHVPGAVNRPFADNLDTRGRFRPAPELGREFSALLQGRDPREVAHACGSGVTACHNLLAMEHAGLHGSRLYAPSWSGWCSDRSRPVATGEA